MLDNIFREEYNKSAFSERQVVLSYHAQRRVVW